MERFELQQLGGLYLDVGIFGTGTAVKVAPHVQHYGEAKMPPQRRWWMSFQIGPDRR
jgi:hypothetical protein